MVFLGAPGNSWDAGVYRAGRGDRPLVVELADSGSFWLATDHVLGSGRAACAMPDSVRRIGNARGRRTEYGPPYARTHAGAHVRALGTHDTRGARTLPARHARALRHGPIDQRGTGAVTLKEV